MKTRLQSLNVHALNNTTTSSADNMEITAVAKFDIFFLLFVFVLSLITNGFLVGKIITDKRLQTSINFLLMIHNILNILLCFLTLLPAAVMLSAKIPTMPSGLCQVTASGYLLVNYLSITNLASIAIDRWRTISNHKYTLVTRQIVIAQVIHFAVAVAFALPWTLWINQSNSMAEFSPGFLKCRIVHKFGTQSAPIVVFLIVTRFLICLVFPSVVMSFCFVKIFHKVRRKWNSVGPMIHAPDGIPVGCYLKSAYTNALLISGFILLRFPELLYTGVDPNRSNSDAIYFKRFVAYISWIETVLFPLVCIMRNTTLLRRVTSMACCNFVINMLTSKQDKRRRLYEVEQSNNVERCISTPSQESNETGMTTFLTGSVSTVRTSSPLWSKASTGDAWTMPTPVTVF